MMNVGRLKGAKQIRRCFLLASSAQWARCHSTEIRRGRERQLSKIATKIMVAKTIQHHFLPSCSR